MLLLLLRQNKILFLKKWLIDCWVQEDRENTKYNGVNVSFSTSCMESALKLPELTALHVDANLLTSFIFSFGK